jgi:hypothetical protein
LDEPTNDVDTEIENRPARIEVKLVLWGVLTIIVLGGLYVLFIGSPTKYRAAEDSSNSPPAAVYTRVAPTSAKHN